MTLKYIVSTFRIFCEIICWTFFFFTSHRRPLWMVSQVCRLLTNKKLRARFLTVFSSLLSLFKHIYNLVFFNSIFQWWISFLGIFFFSGGWQNRAVQHAKIIKGLKIYKVFFFCHQLAKFRILQGICLYNMLVLQVGYNQTDACFHDCGVVGDCGFWFKMQNFIGWS